MKSSLFRDNNWQKAVKLAKSDLCMWELFSEWTILCFMLLEQADSIQFSLESGDLSVAI